MQPRGRSRFSTPACSFRSTDVVELPCSKFPCTCDQTADGAEVSDRDDEREKERVKTERLPTGSSPTTSPPRSGLALVSFRLRVPRSPP